MPIVSSGKYITPQGDQEKDRRTTKAPMISQTLSTQLVFMIRKISKPDFEAIFMYSNEHPQIIVELRQEKEKKQNFVVILLPH